MSRKGAKIFLLTLLTHALRVIEVYWFGERLSEWVQCGFGVTRFDGLLLNKHKHLNYSRLFLQGEKE